jgi:hypothetical protein
MNSEKSSELTSFCLGMSDRNDMTAVEKKLRAENEIAATTRLCKARALCPLIKILVYCPAPSGTIHHLHFECWMLTTNMLLHNLRQDLNHCSIGEHS